jgi:hypothetical protein
LRTFTGWQLLFWKKLFVDEKLPSQDTSRSSQEMVAADHAGMVAADQAGMGKVSEKWIDQRVGDKFLETNPFE